MNAEDLKASLLSKLNAKVGLPNPADNKLNMVSNLDAALNKPVEFKPANDIKDITINATLPELPKDVLAPSSATDEKAFREYMANLKLTDPTKYKIEYAKQQHLAKMKEMSAGYAAAAKERQKRKQ